MLSDNKRLLQSKRVMKVKNKRFRERQNKRMAKRERHQKLIAKLMTNFGGGLSLSWQLFRIKIGKKVLASKKLSKNWKTGNFWGKNQCQNKSKQENKLGKNYYLVFLKLQNQSLSHSAQREEMLVSKKHGQNQSSYMTEFLLQKR